MDTLCDEYDEYIYFYLIKNRRYILDDINKIDGQYYKLIRKVDGKIKIFTDKYIYEFEKIDNENVRNLALFIQRKNYEDLEDKEYINSLPPKINDVGYPYIYSEKDLEIYLGDFPTPEELLQRYKKKYQKE